jgi:hypothetical protein
MFSRKKRPTFIKGNVLTNPTVENNTVSGDVDFLDVKRAENLRMSGNRHIAPKSSRDIKHWYEKPLGIFVLGVLIAVISGAILFYLGLV